MTDTYIYFARESRTGLTKVGRSVEPYLRIEQLRLQEQCEVVLLAEFECGTLHPSWCELSVQFMFADKHIRGEWFRLEAGDVERGMAALRSIRNEQIPDRQYLWPRLPWRRRKKKFVTEAV